MYGTLADTHMTVYTHGYMIICTNTQTPIPMQECHVLIDVCADGNMGLHLHACMTDKLNVWFSCSMIYQLVITYNWIIACINNMHNAYFNTWMPTNWNWIHCNEIRLGWVRCIEWNEWDCCYDLTEWAAFSEQHILPECNEWGVWNDWPAWKCIALCVDIDMCKWMNLYMIEWTFVWIIACMHAWIHDCLTL